MATLRATLTLGFLAGLFALGCGGSDDDGGASGGAGGAAGSSSGGSAGTAAGGSGGAGTSVCPGVKGSCYSDAVHKCGEYGGTQGDETFVTYEANCADPAVWSTSACTDTGKVGSCKFDEPNGPCNTIVFYAPLTAADGQAECAAASNGQWVP